MREKFREWLYQVMNSVCSESFLETNPKQEIVYPYLVYETTASDTELQEPFIVDIYLVDNQKDDTIRLEALVDSIKEKFNRQLIIATDFMVQTEYRSAKNLPALAPSLKRRWVQVYCKVDWRQYD